MLFSMSELAGLKEIFIHMSIQKKKNKKKIHIIANFFSLTARGGYGLFLRAPCLFP